MMTFVKNKKEFKIFNYHSRKHNDKPEEEIALIISYIRNQEGYTILAGDFNTIQNHPVFSPLYEGSYTPAIYNQKTTLKRKCVKDIYRNYAIDNVFLSKDIMINKGRVVDFVKACNNLEEARKISDHLPVSVFFVLN
jgi:endonuclease/exonuclease/phosphatase family metal-dependent hydrolase